MSMDKVCVCVCVSTTLILTQQNAAPDPWRHLWNICDVTSMMVTSTADRGFVCVVMVCCNFPF